MMKINVSITKEIDIGKDEYEREKFMDGRPFEHITKKEWVEHFEDLDLFWPDDIYEEDWTIEVVNNV